MEILHRELTSILSRLGLGEVTDLTAAPQCLRFSVGGEEPVYLADHREPNGLYIQNALDRALALFRSLPRYPDLMVLESSHPVGLPPEVYPEDLTRAGLPAPEETHTETRNGLVVEQACWSLRGEPAFLRSLFREIIRGEISPQGLEFLVGSLYFGDAVTPLLFQLCDDRSVCIAAGNGKILLPLAEKYRDLLPEDLHEDSFKAPGKH